MSYTKEQDDVKQCPPGMKAVDGKCVDASAGETAKTEEGNAGDSSSVGAGTNTDASTKPNPPNTHECPPGSSWNADTETCEPSGNPAGQVGGGGAGAAATPGKEQLETFYKMFEKLMASHSGFNQDIVESLKEYNTSQLNRWAEKMGLPQYKPESAAFGVKTEASSYVDDSKANSVYAESVTGPARFFEACNPKNRKSGESLKESYAEWTIRPEAYLASLKKGWMNYGSNQAHGKLEGEQKNNTEAFTITGGDMPQVFSKQVYLIPGGRMRVPIRQFLDTKILETADRFNWYKVNGFAFDDITNEGSEPTTEEAQTITKVTATPALLRANQTVRYSDIENAPFDLIEAFNRAAALGALDAEATDVLDTVYDAITPTNWVDEAGVVITEDDVANVGTATQEMIYHGMRLIQNQGGDTSPGNMVAFLHPKPLTELILDVTNEFFTGGGTPTPLMNSSMGVLENRLGVDIVATNAVATKDNTTNDAIRNVLAMKGSLGLAVAAELQIEAQRRPDLSAVKVGARHRLKGAVLDETMTCRMSTAD